MAFEIKREDGSVIQLTDGECYRVFEAVLTGISSAVISTYLENTFGAGAGAIFTGDILARLGKLVADGFLDELHEGVLLPKEPDAFDFLKAEESPGKGEGDAI